MNFYDIYKKIQLESPDKYHPTDQFIQIYDPNRTCNTDFSEESSTHSTSQEQQISLICDFNQLSSPGSISTNFNLMRTNSYQSHQYDYMKESKDDLKDPKVDSNQNNSQNLDGPPTTKHPIFHILRKKISKSSHNQTAVKIMKVPNGKALKNIPKNYGKQFIRFATQPGLGNRVLRQFLKDANKYIQAPIEDSSEEKLNHEVTEFRNYYKTKKPDLSNIDHFKSLFLELDNESPQIRKFKMVFREICLYFVEYYSHNWIFSSHRMLDKWEHIYYRKKIVRRIKNPNGFRTLT